MSTMTIIGTFTASDNGYTGSIKTLTLNIKGQFRPVREGQRQEPSNDQQRLRGLRQSVRAVDRQAGSAAMALFASRSPDRAPPRESPFSDLGERLRFLGAVVPYCASVEVSNPVGPP